MENTPTRHVLADVPQGSVLGPCLFLMYIYDMQDTIKSNIRLIADDTIMYLTISNQEDCNSLCNGIASLGNMQISKSRLCELSKCWVYSAVNHPWWMSMLFHRRGLLWLGSAVRYIWWQRWDDDNRQTGVALPM